MKDNIIKTLLVFNSTLTTTEIVNFYLFIYLFFIAVSKNAYRLVMTELF